MGNGNLQGLRIAILVTDGFEQVELEKPRAALDDAGADTVVVSPKDKTVLGMNHIDQGDEFIVDQQMEHAEPDDFDAVLLPGAGYREPAALHAVSLFCSKSSNAFARPSSTSAEVSNNAWAFGSEIFATSSRAGAAASFNICFNLCV